MWRFTFGVSPDLATRPVRPALVLRVIFEARAVPFISIRIRGVSSEIEVSVSRIASMRVVMADVQVTYSAADSEISLL